MFLHENFLLTTEASRKMFTVADAQPIFDWHCHLSPQEIYENKAPRDIAQLWLGGDHYKWRAMRSCGLPERLITGDAPAREKFMAWAACMPKLIGNPLYHWTHLELQRYFRRFAALNESTADATWDDCSRQIENGGFTPQELIAKSNVKALCTTDDPADSLEYHILLKERSMPFKVLPAFRPDRALAVDQPGFLPWLGQLEQAVGYPIKDFQTLRQALTDRIGFFDTLGCRASDHGMKYIPFAPWTEFDMYAIFTERLQNKPLSKKKTEQFQTALLQHLAGEYAKRGWAMELHIGPMRDNNARMLRRAGPDTGFDSIGDWPVAEPLSRFLDSMDAQGKLPKTILFNLNPRDTYVLCAMLGNFQSDEPPGFQIPGKLQYGPAWWFLDHIEGMRAQLQTLANLGALGTFVGMATDSRSFLSYPRHEYFRRIFCGLCGEWVEQGLFPDDAETLMGLTRDICYGNAERYFGA